MTSGKPQPPKSRHQIEREKRLAEALRANLRRRKMADSSGMATREEKPADMRPEPAACDDAES
jgi:hypothetical protein